MLYSCWVGLRLTDRVVRAPNVSNLLHLQISQYIYTPSVLNTYDRNPIPPCEPCHTDYVPYIKTTTTTDMLMLVHKSYYLIAAVKLASVFAVHAIQLDKLPGWRWLIV